MNILKLSWKYLIAKPFSTLLSIILVALGVSLASLLMLLNKQFEDRLYNNIEDIHLVVGAKGSPLQMILSSVYQIDVPTGNIPLKESFAVTKNPYVEKAIPLALGDSYEGFRIVGTDKQYYEHYKAELAEGAFFKKELEVTAGARVAKKLGLKIGDQFFGSHGIVKDGGHVHENAAYTVVGILKESNKVIDQLLLTDLTSVWKVHEGHDHEDHKEDKHAHDHEGHDHADHKEDKHAHDHEGHDHADHKEDKHAQDHEGHDHEDHKEDKHAQDHEGHDHADHKEDKHAHDHEGHDHADHKEDKHAQDHEGHDHEDHKEDKHAQDHEGHDHEGHEHADHKESKTQGTEITAYLVTYKKDGNGNTSARATIEAPRIIDEHSESLGYAKPAIELQRLLEMTGVGMELLTGLALIIIIISAFSMFISLYSSLKERRYEIALMRVMGAPRFKLFSMIILEGLLVAVIGFCLGTALSHLGMELMASNLEESYQYTFTGLIFLQEEIGLAAGALGIGFLAALLPAIQAYKTNISNTLSQS